MGTTNIIIHDKEFKPLFSEQEINEKITVIASQINDLNKEHLLCISVLNGAFMFTAQLCKQLHGLPVISFVKVASYQGMESTGNVTQLLGIQDDLQGKTVLLIEDIVDTGTTIDSLYTLCKQRGAAEVYIATLVYKPNAYKGAAPIHFVGFEIPNDFVVGYGMDYNGIGRNLKEIYVVNTK